MAGSIAWFKYVADDGTEYNVKIDKTNAAAGGFSAADDLADPVLPKGMHMRYANLVHATSGAKRKLYVAEADSDLWSGVTNTASLWNQGQATPGLETFTVTSRIGERRTNAPNLTDTGLTV